DPLPPLTCVGRILTFFERRKRTGRSGPRPFPCALTAYLRLLSLADVRQRREVRRRAVPRLVAAQALADPQGLCLRIRMVGADVRVPHVAAVPHHGELERTGLGLVGIEVLRDAYTKTNLHDRLVSHDVVSSPNR